MIEVFSPASESRDRREKRLLYERLTISEYWIVSPNGFVEVYGLGRCGRYGAPVIASIGESVTSLCFRELVIGVDDIFEGLMFPVRRVSNHQAQGVAEYHG